jgi:hypothetical protein
VSWDYKENKIVQGATYRTLDEVKDDVKRWSCLKLKIVIHALLSCTGCLCRV